MIKLARRISDLFGFWYKLPRATTRQSESSRCTNKRYSRQICYWTCLKLRGWSAYRELRCRRVGGLHGNELAAWIKYFDCMGDRKLYGYEQGFILFCHPRNG